MAHALGHSFCPGQTVRMVDIQLAFRCAALFTGLFGSGPGLHFLMQAASSCPAGVDVGLFILYRGVDVKAQAGGCFVPDEVAVFRGLWTGRPVDIELQATGFRVSGIVMFHRSGDGTAMSFCKVMDGAPVDHRG